MFQGLSNLIILIELVLVIPLLVIVVGLITKDPLGGLTGVFLFGLVCSRGVHHWRRALQSGRIQSRVPPHHHGR
jgi:hypothetical protein